MLDLRQRLMALRRSDEVLSALQPEGLASGRWWPSEGDVRPWPEALRAGVLEPRRGYRFRPENLALPAVIGGRRAARVLDLGAGSGSLTLLAAWACQASHAVALELQPEVAERLQRTLSAHALSASVCCGDLREAQVRAEVLTALGGPADAIVTNPPFFPAGWGRPSAQRSTRLSTHAEHGDVGDFLQAARALLAPGGLLYVVYDAQRAAELLARLGEHDWTLRELHWIGDQRPGRARQPFRVWAVCALEGGALTRPIIPTS